ncbi:MAG TPA: MarR family transcriptional regulator [Casimicrobiaceae bacterium]
MSDSAGHAWAVFLTAHAVLVEAVEARLAQAGLPPLAWYDVLWALERLGEGRKRMHELAELVVLSRSNLTRLVDRLEKARLVRRVASEDDRRGAYAELTAEGRKLRRRMWPVYSAAIEELFGAHLTRAEAENVSRALEKAIAGRRLLPAQRAPRVRAVSPRRGS